MNGYGWCDDHETCKRYDPDTMEGYCPECVDDELRERLGKEYYYVGTNLQPRLGNYS